MTSFQSPRTENALCSQPQGNSSQHERDVVGETNRRNGDGAKNADDDLVDETEGGLKNRFYVDRKRNSKNSTIVAAITMSVHR
jgi:hypothetical protein